MKKNFCIGILWIFCLLFLFLLSACNSYTDVLYVLTETEELPSRENPTGEVPAEEDSEAEGGSESGPSEENTADEVPLAEAPADEGALEENPADEGALAEAPEDEGALEENPADEGALEELLADEISSDEGSTEEVPGDENLTDEKSISENLPIFDELYTDSSSGENNNEDSANSLTGTNNSKSDSEDYQSVLPQAVKEREWSLLIYMGADNNLEASAIEDLYEMEMSKLDTQTTNVLILMDRSNQYDTSNGNWSGAKLYKLVTGKSESEQKIISEELDCPLLALKKGEALSLDLSSSSVLESLMTFMKEKYPANHYGLIMWGHGTGWRGEADNNNQSIFKGFAYDDSSKTYMTLKQFGKALEKTCASDKLDFLGFDTCFGAELEIFYELKDYVDYITGSEGLLLFSGWNYQNLFDYFDDCTDKSPEKLCECVVRQFSEQFSASSRASITAVKSEYIAELYQAFDAFMGMAGKKINSASLRDGVMGILYSNSNCDTERYCYGTENSDIYLDLVSALQNLNYYFETKAISLSSSYNAVKNALSKVVLFSWASDRSDMQASINNKSGIGFYFSTLGANGLILSVHPSPYIKGKTSSQISFVADSSGYVPCEQLSQSFLDKLFYTSF